MGSRGSGYSNNNDTSSQEDNSFSQERKDNALWTSDKGAVDAVLRDVTGQQWQNFDKETKDALSSYTLNGYKAINKSLAEGRSSSRQTQNKIDKMTEAIDKCELPQDMWLQRGLKKDVAEAMFGSMSVEAIQSMIDNNQTITNLPFMSCGSAKGSGMTHKPVIMNIFAPKGTKAIYAEPFSMLGNGFGPYWDGMKGQTSYSGEFETIIQRGSILRPTKATEKGGVIYVDVEIVGQVHD